MCSFTVVSHIESLGEFSPSRICSKIKNLLITSIVGLVVEFVVAIDEARVRFTDDALSFILSSFFGGWRQTVLFHYCLFYFFPFKLLFLFSFVFLLSKCCLYSGIKSLTRLSM